MREGGHAFECLEALGEVVCVDAGGEVLTQLGVRLVVVAPGRRLLEHSVHAFDLAVGARVIGLGQAMIDVEPGEGDFEGVPPQELAARDGFLGQAGGGGGVAGRGEVRAVVGEDGVDGVGDGFDQAIEQVAGDDPRGFLVQFDEGEL